MTLPGCVSNGDAEKLTVWLAEHVAQTERHPEQVREELLGWCRTERIEPPSAGLTFLSHHRVATAPVCLGLLGSGYRGGMGKNEPMDKEAAARIQSAAARDPESDSAQSGFDQRAQSVADQREHEDDE